MTNGKTAEDVLVSEKDLESKGFTPLGTWRVLEKPATRYLFGCIPCGIKREIKEVYVPANGHTSPSGAQMYRKQNPSVSD